MREIVHAALWLAGLALLLLCAVSIPLLQGAGAGSYSDIVGLPSLDRENSSPLMASAAAAEPSAPPQPSPSRQQPQVESDPPQKQTPVPQQPSEPARPRGKHDVERAADGPALPANLEVFYCGSTKQKLVALTFDDGPRPEAMGKLLDILAQNDVRATFFFTGVMSAQYPKLVKATATAGHEIGNHTFDHYRLPKLSDAEKGQQIDRCENLLQSITGDRPVFLRPPGGELDPATRRIARERGLVVAMYSVNLRDDPGNLNPKLELEYALRRIGPGAVVLGHSSVESTIEMLPELIRALKKRGYTFLTLSELAAATAKP